MTGRHCRPGIFTTRQVLETLSAGRTRSACHNIAAKRRKASAFEGINQQLVGTKCFGISGQSVVRRVQIPSADANKLFSPLMASNILKKRFWTGSKFHLESVPSRPQREDSYLSH